MSRQSDQWKSRKYRHSPKYNVEIYVCDKSGLSNYWEKIWILKIKQLEQLYTPFKTGKIEHNNT